MILLNCCLIYSKSALWVIFYLVETTGLWVMYTHQNEIMQSGQCKYGCLHQSVVNFNIRKKDLSTTHYEINFNELYDGNNSGDFDLLEKINSLMDFGSVLKLKDN